MKEVEGLVEALLAIARAMEGFARASSEEGAATEAATIRQAAAEIEVLREREFERIALRIAVAEVMAVPELHDMGCIGSHSPAEHALGLLRHVYTAAIDAAGEGA